MAIKNDDRIVDRTFFQNHMVASLDLKQFRFRISLKIELPIKTGFQTGNLQSGRICNYGKISNYNQDCGHLLVLVIFLKEK